MAIERKCPKCAEWNLDNDHCNSCGTVISPQLKEEIREIKKQEIRDSLPPSKFDVFLEKWKTHKFFLIRGTYYVFYSIWLVFMAIGGFFTWISATTVG